MAWERGWAPLGAKGKADRSTRVKYLAFTVLVPLVACGSPQQADSQSIKAIISTAAEWALVNREAERGRVTRVYATTMRQLARAQISTELKTLEQHRSPALPVAAGLAHLPADASPELIGRQVELLRRTETSP